MEDGTERSIYVEVGQQLKPLILTPELDDDNIKSKIREAAGLGPHDVIKLHRSDGQLVNPGRELMSNPPSDPYRVYLAATAVSVAGTNQLDLDLMDLETRLRAVEETVSVLRSDLPPVVTELRRAVDTFRQNLESNQLVNIPGIPTMGICGIEEIPRPRSYRAGSHPYWERVDYRRKVPEDVVLVFSKFRQICDSVVAEETAQCLRLPTFNNWAWEDWEMLMLLQHMFQDLGLTKAFDIEIEVLRNFLSVMYLHYNQVPFHNFQHAFCVTQMMYGLICKCGLKDKLSDIDKIVLICSCICHDLDHPGFNNIYQINARTELAVRYNDISPLENHHCSIAFQILERRQCNIFVNTSHEEYRRIREGMIRCILATDMARHNEILRDFKEVIPVFDFDSRAHVNLLFMILIKVADISNEARPLDIAEPWLECLMQEFFNQSDLEKLEGLPVSPFMDREKVTKPTSQCSFIGFVLLPLFEALGEVLPELEELIIEPVRFALDHYRRLKDMSKRPSEVRIEQLPCSPDSQAATEQNDRRKSCSSLCNMGKDSGVSQENLKVVTGGKQERSMSLKSSIASSRSSLGQQSLEATSPVQDEALDVLDEDPETEVEVMERTSRFKISTEGPISASQKSSFESRPSCDGRVSADSSRAEHRVSFSDGTKSSTVGFNFEEDAIRRNRLTWSSISHIEHGGAIYPRIRTNSEIPNLDNRRFSVRTFADNNQVFLKKVRSKSVADPPTILSNKTYSIAKSKINFKSGNKSPNIFKKHEERNIYEIGSTPQPLIQSFHGSEFNNQKFISPISEKLISDSHEIKNDESSCFNCKKLSISMDVIPIKRNGKFNQEEDQKTLASSEDNLIDTQSDAVSEPSSPKTSKLDAPKNSLFSFFRRSNAKTEKSSHNPL